MSIETTNLQDYLKQFTGTENWHKWSILFGRHVLTDGAKFLAEKAGAYWLMDAIASHHGKIIKKDSRLFDAQFWTLKTNLIKHTAVLTCVADSGEKPVVTQRIPFTDFPLAEIKLYCNLLDERHWCILLPSEY